MAKLTMKLPAVLTNPSKESFMPNIKAELFLSEPEFKEFLEARLLHIEDLARKSIVNWIGVHNKLGEIDIRLARIEDLLKKRA